MKNLKLLSLWTFCMFILIGCEPNLDHEATTVGTVQLETGTFSSGPVCDGKPIMKYASLDEIQNAHQDLFNKFQNSQDEEILREWEQTRSFYSLRKKDEDMDNGDIPEESDFDSWSYTSDVILETMLNQDGMIIIDGYLYLWNDGCVIHRIPFNGCSDYAKMLEFAHFIKTYDGSPMAQQLMGKFRNDHKISDINTCNDYRFDFESLSAQNTKIINDREPMMQKNGSDCGFEAYINHEILAHDGVNNRITIKFEANFIAPDGSNPSQAFMISNAPDFESVRIVQGPWGSENIDWHLEDANTYVYPGEWFVLEVDYSTFNTQVPFLLVDLVGSINLLGQNSCQDFDTLHLNLDCPISISKKPINAQTGQWNFTVEGLPNTGGNYVLVWNFGDGTPEETVIGVNNISHTFPTPCTASVFNVSVSLEKGVFCKSSAGTSLKSWDTCKRQTYTETHKEKFDGKKLKLKLKSKKRWDIFGGGTKLIHKFRYRKNGTKYMKSVGDIYLASGLNCDPQSISSVIPDSQQSGKKRLKQKVSYPSKNFFIDLSNPYSVIFSHSNGYSKTLTFNATCSK